MTPPGPTEPAPDPLDGLPDSARRVHATLQLEGPLTHKELVAATGMPARTVRFAIARLKESGIVSERANLMDGRQTFFYLERG